LKTFLDSGVLLTAWRGKEPESTAALSVLDDGQREFFTSQMVKLELVPKPTFHKQHNELDFHETHFKGVKAEEPFSSDLGKAAFELAKKHGLAAADALNIAAAVRQGAQ
jgi:predicted nucleic acid-binding protein